MDTYSKNPNLQRREDLGGNDNEVKYTYELAADWPNGSSSAADPSANYMGDLS